jgi:HAAS domain-containing protein
MDSPREKAPVDDYLARLNAELIPMPLVERRALLHELRQHLEGLAAAHRELGAAPEAAVLAALRQFGDPVRIGQRLIREW